MPGETDGEPEAYAAREYVDPRNHAGWFREHVAADRDEPTGNVLARENADAVRYSHLLDHCAGLLEAAEEADMAAHAAVREDVTDASFHARAAAAWYAEYAAALKDLAGDAE